MNLTGVFINSICVFLAGVSGSLLKKSISEKIKNTLMMGVGLCVLYIGISGISINTNIMILIISVTIGVIIGEIIDIDDKLNRFGIFIQQKIAYKDDNITDGFIASTLFVCAGAMSIVGSIESGTQGTYNTFLAKTFIDSIVIFIMAATKGKGCSLAAFVALPYQTLLTLSSGYIAQIVNESIISQMSQIGALLIIGIAFNILKVTKIKIGNFILSPFIPILFYLGETLILCLL